MRQRFLKDKRIRRVSRVGSALASDVVNSNLLTYASGMAYISLLSIVPSLAAMFAIISVFQPLADPEATWFEYFQTFILRNLTPDAGEQMISYLSSFLANLDIGRIGAVGFSFLLVTIIMLLRNIEIALNDIWQLANTRSMFKRFLYFWTTITLGALIVSLVIGAVAEFDLANLIPFAAGQTQPLRLPFLPEITTLAATILFFFVLYKIGPNCHVSFRSAIIGALVATVLIRLAATGYGFYMRHSDWNQTIYGAMAAVPLFLIWLYIAWVVILFGANVSWRVQYGFHLKREATDQGALTPSDARDFERNWQLRGLAQMICVVAAVHRFCQGSGHGVRGVELARQLDLPPAWIKEAILSLEEHGLIIVSRRGESDHDDKQDVLGYELFPAFPADQLVVTDLINTLLQDAVDWLAQRQEDLPFALDGILEQMVEAFKTDDKELTLAELVRNSDHSESKWPKFRYRD